MKRKLALSIFLSLGINAINAGTMGEMTPANTFGGLYIGLGTGMLTLISEQTYSTVRVPSIRPPSSGELDYTNSAVLFDGHVGYGAMITPQFYLGAKASIQYTPLEDIHEAPF